MSCLSENVSICLRKPICCYRTAMQKWDAKTVISLEVPMCFKTRVICQEKLGCKWNLSVCLIQVSLSLLFPREVSFRLLPDMSATTKAKTRVQVPAKKDSSFSLYTFWWYLLDFRESRNTVTFGERSELGIKIGKNKGDIVQYISELFCWTSNRASCGEIHGLIPMSPQ